MKFTNTPGKNYQILQRHQVKIIMKFTNTPGKIVMTFNYTLSKIIKFLYCNVTFQQSINIIVMSFLCLTTGMLKLSLL